MKEKIIDLATLDSIRKLQKPGRPDLLKELIQLFLDTTKEYIKVLRTSVANRDLGTVSHIAHSFKSSAANLGALKLAEYCYDLEKIGNGDSGPEQIEKVFQQIEIAHQEAMTELEKI